MNQSRSVASLLLCGFMAGCGAAGEGEPGLGELDQSIVRGQETDRFPQVVMLQVQRQTGDTRCTGSYIAPKLVLTAAHCIGTGAIPQLSYVYYGDGPAPARDMFPEIPAPGEASDVAGIESFRVHPDYDPALNHPDVAVVYLDRELPFAPLSLMKERLGRSSVGEKATIVGWGGSRALTPDISEVEGAGIKRQGQVVMRGSPTLADFHEDDPNAGMLDPAIRADSLKVDGRAPRANGCAGDSGGPLLIKKSGRWQVAGVGYWTGLSCEDYGIFARIDPIKHFVDDALRGLGRAPLVPRLECVDRAENGTYTAFFGYENENGVTLDISHSKRNQLKADRAGVRPEEFGPGDHPWAFSVDFQRKDKLEYLLEPKNGKKRVAKADRNSPACECAAACDAALAAECSPGTISRAQCVADCAPFAQAFPGCGAELDAYWHCVGQLPPSADNWICDPSFAPQPILCQDEFFSALLCAGYL
ncbi:MAG TPA: trypsin-like serine protease [Polyangiaceae bacterium]|nr:trypsin-like serine protease [Polyangiaceae bacterium]